MNPNLTVWQMAVTTEHALRVRRAERSPRIAESVAPRRGNPSIPATAQRHAGALLIRAGERLQGARRAAPAGRATSHRGLLGPAR